MGSRILLFLVAAVLATLAGIVVFPVNGDAEAVTRISVESLNRKLGSENLIIVDSRSGADWRSSEFKIKNSIRGEAGKEAQWSEKISKDAEIVVYCA